MFDDLVCGRKLKTLTVADDCSKEAVRIAGDSSIAARYVTRLPGEAIANRGKPRSIRSDNGHEFSGRVLQAWAAERTIEHRFVLPGKPTQNPYIESFNSRFRDECRSQQWLAGLSKRRSVIDNLREDYNHRWPRSSCGYVPRVKFAAHCRGYALGSADPINRQPSSDTIQPLGSNSSRC